MRGPPSPGELQFDLEAYRACREFFELLHPLSYAEFGMNNQIEIDAEGYAHPPASPGIGVDFDWDFIDNCTVRRF
jgi:L-alanine-DL-glutamate epimerase-like enolase superfamily enzyme